MTKDQIKIKLLTLEKEVLELKLELAEKDKGTYTPLFPTCTRPHSDDTYTYPWHPTYPTVTFGDTTYSSSSKPERTDISIN